jgi:hypothetical protein
LKTTTLFLSTLGLAIAAGAALAHPLPKSADPKPNAALTVSPTEILIRFSEGLVGDLSGIEIRDKNGKAVPAGTASVNPRDSTQLILPLTRRLASGTYTVEWHAVGDDTHRVAGHYGFHVK